MTLLDDVNHYNAEGVQILNTATNALHDPAAAASLTTDYGVTLLSALGVSGGQVGDIAKIGVGALEGGASGFAMGGPIGAVAGGVIGFAQGVIDSIGGPPPDQTQVTRGPCPGAHSPEQNLWNWRSHWPLESDNKNLVGTALGLAWLQIDPHFGDPHAGPNVATALGAYENFYGYLLGWCPFLPGRLPDIQNPNSRTPIGPSDVNVKDFNEYERPPTGNVVQTSRGPVSYYVFESLSLSAGGDNAAQTAISRLPDNAYLEHFNDDQTGIYGPMLVTILGHLTIGGSDQSIASELKMQLATLIENGVLTPNQIDPWILGLIHWYENTLPSAPTILGFAASGPPARPGAMNNPPSPQVPSVFRMGIGSAGGILNAPLLLPPSTSTNAPVSLSAPVAAPSSSSVSLLGGLGGAGLGFVLGGPIGLVVGGVLGLALGKAL